MCNVGSSAPGDRHGDRHCVRALRRTWLHSWLFCGTGQGAPQTVRWSYRALPSCSWCSSLMVLHAVEIWLYAGLYRIAGAIPDLETALYFSTASFTTIGYGDVVLGPEWRLIERHRRCQRAFAVRVVDGLLDNDSQSTQHTRSRVDPRGRAMRLRAAICGTAGFWSGDLLFCSSAWPVAATEQRDAGRAPPDPLRQNHRGQAPGCRAGAQPFGHADRGGRDQAQLFGQGQAHRRSVAGRIRIQGWARDCPT